MDLLDALKQFAAPPRQSTLVEQLDASLEKIEKESPREPERPARSHVPESPSNIQVAGEGDRQPVRGAISDPVARVGTDISEADTHVWDKPFHFVTGAAGSGKTWLTRDRVAQSPAHTCIVMASTGIAAVNLGDAITINSQLGYFDTSSMVQNYTHGILQQRLRRLRQAGVRRLILDEVSMFEAEQLTCLVRAINELNSEAGTSKASVNYFDDDRGSQELGLTLVGDFLQLPPIKGKYAFESPEWHHFDKGVETLTEIRRQGNEDFIAALRACRAQQPDLVCDYFRKFIYPVQDGDFGGTTILAKNDAVERMNRFRLDSLPGTADSYLNSRQGKERGEWKHIPPALSLKPNAQVMILSNRYEDDPDGGRRPLLYANGDNAIYLGKNPSGHAMVQLERTGQAVEVKWITRENKAARKDPHYVCSNPGCKTQASSGHVKKCPVCGWAIKKDLYEILGEITYMPLRLAYASTVHKTQGLTLDKVQIAFGDHFFTSFGMLYVALSRARGPEGLRLIGTVDQLRARVRMDPAVARWR